MYALTSLLLLAAPLGFEEALDRATAAPELEGTARAAQALEAGLPQLGAFTSNPLLLAQPGVRDQAGAVGPEGQVSLTQNLNLGGLAAARREVARGDARSASLQLHSARQARRLAVGRAWLETWLAHAAAVAAKHEEAGADALVQRLERALPTGGVTRVEVATARAFAAETAAVHLEWEGRLIDAGAALAALLGLDDIATVQGAPPELPAPASPLRLPERSPQVRVLEAEAGDERLRAAESKAQWATQLQLSVQVGHDFPLQWFGNVGVGVTLPVLEHGAREQSAHLAQQLRLEGQAEQARRAARLAKQVLVHDLEHTEETYAVVHGRQWPAAEEAARLEARRFEAGEATLLELTSVRRLALQAQLAALRAEANRVEARLRARELQELP